MVENAVDILLVEDSAGDAELAMAGLKARSLGNKVVHLVDGDAALEFVFAASVAANVLAANTPRLIVLDLNLSGATQEGGAHPADTGRGDDRFGNRKGDGGMLPAWGEQLRDQAR